MVSPFRDHGTKKLKNSSLTPQSHQWILQPVVLCVHLLQIPQPTNIISPTSAFGSPPLSTRIQTSPLHSTLTNTRVALDVRYPPSATPSCPSTWSASQPVAALRASTPFSSSECRWTMPYRLCVVLL